MEDSIQEYRARSLRLLDLTGRDTRALLSRLDPELMVHTDERAWRVRDVIGHLGVWNLEAARSLHAHAEGHEYHCVEAETEYDAYNGPAADERRRWTLEEVWAEYDEGHEQLKSLIESMPDAKWNVAMNYPWNEHGTVENLIEIMMVHERSAHCAVVEEAVASGKPAGRAVG